MFLSSSILSEVHYEEEEKIELNKMHGYGADGNDLGERNETGQSNNVGWVWLGWVIVVCCLFVLLFIAL